jgi:enoyl-CoA hydratase/carnithine racemase
MLVAERRGHVLVATLARPPVNAIDAALLGRLEAIVAQAETDESISLLHLRSAQRVFCAGADLGLMRACFAEGAPERMVALVRGMQQVFTRIERAPFATLAEIAGAALGGGLELALACDLRVAAHEAQLGLPEIGLGLLPAAGGTQRLSSLCGPGVARQLILGGETVDGRQARELGLVQWTSPTEALADFAAALAQRGDGLLAALVVDVGDDDMRALRAERVCRRAPDARGCAGHDGELVLQIHASLPCR